MSETEKDQAFYDMADEFIALANQFAKQVDKGKVSAAFLYAAARFNTFVVAASANNASELSEYALKAQPYFEGEYKKMLREHFADYTENFSAYMATESPNKNLN
ncbi:MAG: DUF3144 domain-containing protein [Gammaproteobacteria bacterium]|nr:DUF3144 domain-containing protein [Gammaproteobacteria bacterium]